MFGQVDGYSRLITILRLSTNNRASTALHLFIESIREYGVPSRVRADGGSEFNHVEFLMNRLNGDSRSSVIRGPSVHNQRIERLWRDVYCKVLDRYYKLSMHMESHRILDLANGIHMFCLQYVSAPRINADLRSWWAVHNNHRIRTERNQSPLQLWHAGNIQSQSIDSTAMNNLFRRNITDVNEQTREVLSRYSMEEPDNITVVLPRYSPPLTNDQLEQLNSHVNTTQESSSQGLDIYASAIRFVMQYTTNR